LIAMTSQHVSNSQWRKKLWLMRKRGSCKFEMDQTPMRNFSPNIINFLWAMEGCKQERYLRNMKIIHQRIPLMKRRLHMNYGQQKDLSVIDPLSMGVWNLRNCKMKIIRSWRWNQS
jgi:hypothetical protein